MSGLVLVLGLAVPCRHATCSNVVSLSKNDFAYVWMKGVMVRVRVLGIALGLGLVGLGF